VGRDEEGTADRYWNIQLESIFGKARKSAQYNVDNYKNRKNKIKILMNVG